MVFMKIEFLGADREVTGSCHYVAFGETHFLVDCGLEVDLHRDFRIKFLLLKRILCFRQ